ncbi:MAG: DNA-binding transcriptional LysR family regulator [Cognaticolwellia sp.]|jgi:DNA-binding transcriptional LysR family regulator
MASSYSYVDSFVDKHRVDKQRAHNWDDLKLFAVAARTGSMSAAARELGLGQATLSRRISNLEQQSGHRLFDRTPRGLRLTQAGERALPFAQSMVQSSLGLAHAMSAHDSRPAGVVRIAMPPGIAETVILPIIPELRARYPDLGVELLASADLLDLVAGQADIALRSKAPSHPELVGIHLFDSGVGVWASPALHTEGLTLAELPWVGWSQSHRQIVQARLLKELVPEPIWAVRSDSFVAQIQAARLGLGAIMMGSALARHIGGLVPVASVADEWPSEPAYAVVHKDLRRVPRVRVVLDFLQEQVQSWAL